MMSRQEVQVKFNVFYPRGLNNEAYTQTYPRQTRVGAAAVIKYHFQNGEITFRCLFKRLSNNNTIFAAEAAAITLALDYYQRMEPVRHDAVVYSDSMSC